MGRYWVQIHLDRPCDYLLWFPFYTLKAANCLSLIEKIQAICFTVFFPMQIYTGRVRLTAVRRSVVGTCAFYSTCAGQGIHPVLEPEHSSVSASSASWPVNYSYRSAQISRSYVLSKRANLPTDSGRIRSGWPSSGELSNFLKNCCGLLAFDVQLSNDEVRTGAWSVLPISYF